jgi:hypothetical protein
LFLAISVEITSSTNSFIVYLTTKGQDALKNIDASLTMGCVPLSLSVWNGHSNEERIEKEKKEKKPKGPTFEERRLLHFLP